MTSVQVSHVHDEVIGSGRTPLVNEESEIEDRGASAALMFLRIWAEGSGTVRGRDPDVGEVVGRLEPAILVVSISWTSSSESRVRSMALFSTLSFAAFSASL